MIVNASNHEFWIYNNVNSINTFYERVFNTFNILCLIQILFI